ncbi:hypothetical protein ANO14919_061270 [Xylariales sp. No.14919]|nr:hypothetical protein ANO14919_061270 [Xylariales sp. No.14919]
MSTDVKFLGLRGTPLNIAIAVVTGTDLLLFGYDQGVIGGLLTLPSFTKTFPELCTTAECQEGLTDYEKVHQSIVQGVAVSSYNLGCFAGALLCIFIGNWLGRRRSIFVGSVTMIVGAILQFTAFGLPHFLIGRVICGIGNGINTSTAPSWQVECAQSHQRGKTLVLDVAVLLFGVTLSYWVDLGFSFIEPSSWAWRAPIALQLIFAGFVAAVILFMPESPRWLVLKGRSEEAAKTLSALNNESTSSDFIAAQVHAIETTAVESSGAGSFRRVFTTGKSKNFQRTALAYGIQVMQQVTGVNLITFYAATIYENQIGLDGFTSRLLAAANGTEYWLASIPAIFLVERFGRRPLLFAGSAGMAASMAILAASTSLNTSAGGITAATFLFVFNSFFALGWVSLPWLISSEVVSVSIRAQANALSTSANWIFNFAVVLITPIAFATIGWKTYILFAVINAASIPAVYFCYPETALRSLEEIDLIFAKSTSVFDAVKVAKTMPRHFGRNGEVLVSMVEEVEAVATADKVVAEHKEIA